MIEHDVFRHQPVLSGELVRLEPLTVDVLEQYLVGLDDPDVSRFTGSTGTFARSRVEQWLRTRVDEHDRADWAAIRIADGAFLGEAVLNQLDVDNASANFRIWLGGQALFGRGYGSEITRLVVDHAFASGLHRVELGVFDFNPRARRAYEKAGFRVEGRRRDALFQDGEWHDELVMGVLHDDPRPVG